MAAPNDELSVKLFQALGSSTDIQENVKKSIYTLKKNNIGFFIPKGMGCAIELRLPELTGSYILTSRRAVSLTWLKEKKHLTAERYCSQYPDHSGKDDHKIEIASSPLHKETDSFVFLAIAKEREPKYFLICDYSKIDSISVLDKPLVAFTFVDKQFVRVKFVYSKKSCAYKRTEVIPSSAENNLSMDNLIGAPVVVQNGESPIVVGVLGRYGSEEIWPVLFNKLHFENISREEHGPFDTTDSNPNQTPSRPNLSYLDAKHLQESKPPQENEEHKADSSIFHKHCIRDKNINGLPPNIWSELYTDLDPRRPLGGDYQTLAGKLGYDMRSINFFAAQKHPTEELLNDWYIKPGQGTIGQLCDALTNSDRDDVVELIKDWIVEQRCNCEKCGNLT